MGFMRRNLGPVPRQFNRLPPPGGFHLSLPKCHGPRIAVRMENPGTQMIHVIVINLARSPDRRSSIKAHLDEMGVPFEFFDAVDGTRLSPEERAFLDVRPEPGAYGRELMAGEIGVAASFLRVLQSIATGDAAYVCVLEDDARLLPTARTFLSEATLRGLPAFDVLRLYHSPRPGRALAAPIAVVGGVHVCVPAYPQAGAVAQIFSRPGAARLVRHLTPMRAPLDVLLYRNPAFACRILETRPSVVVDSAVVSVIGLERGERQGLLNRRKPRHVVGKTLAGILRGARRWPSFVAAWGPAMLLRLRSKGWPRKSQ
jgi:glycosyl transferase family 25